MKRLDYMGNGRVVLVDAGEPRVLPGMVKIKVDYSTLCASDMHIVQHDLMHKPTPFTLGHEGVGTIAELSSEAAACGWRVGDRVACANISNCGICGPCQQGRDQFCTNKYVPAMFQEYALLKLNQLFPIPSGEDIRKYCLLEPCTCALRAIDLSGLSMGDTVLISGMGGSGSLLLNMALLRGASRVIVLDPVPQKRNLARQMGACHAIDPFGADTAGILLDLSDGEGFNVIYEASGAPSAADRIVDYLAPMGTVVFFALYPESYVLKLNLLELYKKEGKLVTAASVLSNYPRCMRIIPRLDAEKILGPTYVLNDYEQAFDMFHQSIYPKILIKC